MEKKKKLYIHPLTTSQLGRFCTDTHKLTNSSNHNLSEKQNQEINLSSS